MRNVLRGASGAALLCGLAGTMPVWGQESSQPAAIQQPSAGVDSVAPQQPSDQLDEDRIVVTGSFLAGTPEDAALPVEVFSQEDLDKQGAPTALEFIKSLSIAGPTTGEAYMFSGASQTGNVGFNLRGLGADKTLTLLNGRRMSENAINIPQAALGRTEILKDGAAVIYGADATGGVVNFITRDDFEGLEARAQYKFVAGSDGEYGASLLGGGGLGDARYLWSVEWDHRSRLSTTERDFSSLPYHINPAAAWSSLTNLAGWIPRGTPPATGITAGNEFGAALGGAVSDFTPASCAAVGGIYVGSTSCQYWALPFYNLVEPQDTYRVYGQIDGSFSDNMNFHVEASYGQVKAETISSPSYPVTRGPARATGATNQFYVPRSNPYVDEFVARSGFAANPLWTNGTAQGFTAFTYRPFGFGGNDHFFSQAGVHGTPNNIDNQVWRISAAVDGTLGEAFGPLRDVGYDVALTHNQAINYIEEPDVLGFRLQEALNGFGGPNCNAADLDPLRYGIQNAAAAGTNGCLWWNPFASNFPVSQAFGLANPNFVAGATNPIELQKWLFDSRSRESLTSSLTLDAVANSETPLTLPGGTVNVAIGLQGRQIETRETGFSEFANGLTPCAWPASSGQTPRNPLDPQYTGCTPDGPGPFIFYSPDPPDYTDQQQYSIFGEMSLPLLDNLNLQAAVRREEFSGGLGATVYKVSGKWDVFDSLSFRGSYGTNYQAPPAGLVPGRITSSQASYTRAGGDWRGSQTRTQGSIVPETATAWNAGAIWQSSGFSPDHDFRFIVDYFDIETEDELGTLATNNDIVNLVFSIPPTGTAIPNNNTALANCSSPLIDRITLNDTATSPGGACVQGQTSALNFASVITEFGNGPGQQVAGFDIQTDYSMPLFEGDLMIGATATLTTRNKLGPKFLDGVQLDAGDDRLGFLNFNVVANAVPEWRANAFANYNFGQHNIRAVANYISGVDDERGPVTPAGVLGVNQFGLTTFGVEGKDWLSFDLHYNFEMTETLRLSASLVNALDKDPPASRQELGYDARIGNALGRTLELSVKQTF
jgi:iron complex outermembrane receptor protein